jgi:hypothetical protein
MNQRIKELAEQAGFDVKRLLAPYPGGFPREDFLALESFAELIVQECVNVLHEKGMWSVHDSNVLKEHFGVEE